MPAAFEWDPRKASRNESKHGVTFEEASSVFSDPLARVVDDPRGPAGEPRLIILGHSRKCRLLAVMFTERGERIRVISARLVTRAERKDYEENRR